MVQKKVRMTKLSIIIPVYNEAGTVGQLLDNVNKVSLPGIEKEIIIIEDNSRDGSRRIVKAFAKNHKGVSLILRSKGLGKGSAVIEGFKKITGQIVLIQDADLEYDVADYSKLLKPILENKTDFVLGSRHMRKDGEINWSIRKFKGKDRLTAYLMNIGGGLFHKFFNLVYGVNLTDPTTMYKVFRSKLLKEVHFEGRFFELDWEIVSKFIRKGHPPIEVPVKYESRGFAEGKKVNFFRDVYRWLIMIIKVRLLPISDL